MYLTGWHRDHTYNLTLVTPPSSEPVTLAEAKLHLRAVSDTDEDTHISNLITAARMLGEKISYRQYITAVWKLTLDSLAPGCIEIPFGPLIPGSNNSNITIKYDDVNGTEQTLASNQYTVDATGLVAKIYPGYLISWPYTRPYPASVRVTFTAGYGAASAVPNNVKQAILMTVATWYETREDQSESHSFGTRLPPAAVDLFMLEHPGVL